MKREKGKIDFRMQDYSGSNFIIDRNQNLIICGNEGFEWGEFKFTPEQALEIAEAFNPWISVEERLPEEIPDNERTVSNRRIVQIYPYETSDWVAEFRNGIFESTHYAVEIEGVTHWRELPAPPQEVKS